jgi:hypothetical protein
MPGVFGFYHAVLDCHLGSYSIVSSLPPSGRWPYFVHSFCFSPFHPLDIADGSTLSHSMDVGLAMSYGLSCVPHQIRMLKS